MEWKNGKKSVSKSYNYRSTAELLPNCGFFFCQNSSFNANPSIVADKCLAGICMKCLAPESYLKDKVFFNYSKKFFRQMVLLHQQMHHAFRANFRTIPVQFYHTIRHLIPSIQSSKLHFLIPEHYQKVLAIIFCEFLKMKKKWIRLYHTMQMIRQKKPTIN